MSPILELQGISKRYGAVVASDNLSLHLDPEEALGVIGPNGSGKTTTFNIITGIALADSGQIFLAGTEITRLRAFERCRRGIARSFQIPHAFGGMTVFENLLVSAMDLAATLLDGVLLGGLYALFAGGLSLIFGVMRLVNIAHGDLILLSAFVALTLTTYFPIHPLFSLLLVVPLMAVLGYVLQRTVFNRTLGNDILPPLLVSFGLSVFLQNALLQIFRADSQRLHAGPLETSHIDLPFGITMGALPSLMFSVAVLVIGGLQLLLYRTTLGRALRAVSDDGQIAQLMGINTAHLYGVAMAISLAVVSVAGVFLGIRANFDPSIGPTRLIFAFEAIIIGGLGDLWGTLAGGVILGIAQTLGGRINPGYQILAGHLVFLAILTVRPQGFFPRTGHRVIV
jgi:branched-chain amino acid transport system permease protein